jgi:hypothetical protein
MNQMPQPAASLIEKLGVPRKTGVGWGGWGRNSPAPRSIDGPSESARF